MANQEQVSIIISAVDKATDVLNNVAKGFDGLEGGMKKIVSGAKIAGAAIAGAGAAAFAFSSAAVLQFSEVGDEIEKMAGRTGLAAESVSALRVAADASGTSIQDVELAVKKMQIGMDLLSKKTAPDLTYQLEAIGFSLDDIKAMSPDKQFETIGNAIAMIEDPAQRTRLAFEAFGKSGTDLIPLFEDGNFSMAQWSEQAKKLGVSFDDLAANKAAQLNDAIGFLKTAVQGLTLSVGAALAPTLVDLATRAMPVLEQVGDFLAKVLPPVIGAMIDLMGWLIQRFMDLKPVADAIIDTFQKIYGFLVQSGIIDAFQYAFERLGNTFREKLVPAIQELLKNLEPLFPVFEAIISVIGIGIVGALLGLVEMLNVVTSAFTAFIDFLNYVIDSYRNFGANVKAVWEDLKNSTIGTWDAIKSSVGSAVDWVMEKVRAAIDAYNRMKAIVGAPVNAVGNAVSGLMSKIPGFATGGIVPGMLGEPQLAIVHGGERVVPAAGMALSGGGTGITINISGNYISGENDIDRLTQRVGEELMRIMRLNNKF